MFKSLSIIIVILMLTLTKLGDAAELFKVTYHRDSGTPTEQYISFTLSRSGELQIANADLVDDVVELAVSTRIILDGTTFLLPFVLPAGTTHSTALNAGSHTITSVLKGRPGGAITLSVSEQSGVGYEILTDGTVLQRSTGLHWHRDPCTPGPVVNCDSEGLHCNSESRVSPNLEALFYQGGIWTSAGYVTALNNGEWGTDADSGNAGHSDWRVPTIHELESLVDYRFIDPAIANADGGGTIAPAPLFGQEAGHQFGQPFWMCPIYTHSESGVRTLPPECSNSKHRGNADYYYLSNLNTNWALWFDPVQYGWGVQFYYGWVGTWPSGCVWPVRGN